MDFAIDRNDLNQLKQPSRFADVPSLGEPVVTDAETARPDLNPMQGANELGKTENHTIQGTPSQNQFNDQAKHFEADEEPYGMPQEQEMQLLNKEEDEYNHLYALDPTQVENKELDQITC